MKHNAGAGELEREIRRISAIGLEKNLKRGRRAPMLPIPVRGKLISVASGNVTQEIDKFISMHSAGYKNVAISTR